MLFRRFAFAPFHRTANSARRGHLALAAALRSAIGGHSRRRLCELFELHKPTAFARALSLLPLRAQLDALSMLSSTVRWQLWPYLSADVRRALLPLAPQATAVAGGLQCAQ